MATPHLKIPRAEAEKKLDCLMSEGQAIYDTPALDQKRIDRENGRLRRWHEQCKVTLHSLMDPPLVEEIEITVPGVGPYTRLTPIDDQALLLRDNLMRVLRGLHTIRRRLDLFEEPPTTTPKTKTGTDQVFIVHGHDNELLQSVARFLESKVGLKVVILHEQPGRNQTITEKLERESLVSFAVVLLSPDDIGCVAGRKTGSMSPRARQNVILELGFFWGKFGRDRVCCIKRGNIELPTDYVGPEWIDYDDGGGWKLNLARELKAAGFGVDPDKFI